MATPFYDPMVRLQGSSYYLNEIRFPLSLALGTDGRGHDQSVGGRRLVVAVPYAQDVHSMHIADHLFGPNFLSSAIVMERVNVTLTPSVPISIAVRE